MTAKLSPSDLRTVSDLSEEYHVGKPFVAEALVGLTPVYSRNAGRGTMNLYEAAEAHAAMKMAIGKRDADARAAAPSPTQSVVQHVAQQVDLAPVFAQLDAINKAILALDITVQRLRADTLGRLDVIALRDELEAITVGEMDDGPPPVLNGTTQPPVVTAVTTSAVKPRKPRIAIIAAPGAIHDRIKRQFGDVFEIKHLDSKDAVSRSFSSWVSGCSHVIGMLDFMNHGVGGIDRHAGYTYVPLKGGQSTLLVTLNELFTQLTEPA